MQRFFTKIKQLIVDWCLQSEDKEIESLYLSVPTKDISICDENGYIKFIGESHSDVLVQTKKGWAPIKRILKTIPYQAWELIIEGFEPLLAADQHIIMTEAGPVWMKDLQINDLVYTLDGLKPVKSIRCLNEIDHMYDLELDDEDHVFYTNGILSHNTTVIAMYILWFALFQKGKTCVIASKSMEHAVEIMSRIKFSYEELPNWLKAGCKFFNRTTIEFDNKSKIKCEATSEKTGRGGSPAILMIDEISFISKKIQEKMWASITPSLSTGGKFVLTSTPNGDTDLYATLWRGAMSKTNSFVPVQAMWYEHPDRGPEYYKEMLGKLGPIVVRQELDCEFLSSDALLINSMKLQQLKYSLPSFEDMGFKFWADPNTLGGHGKTYLVSLDPATGNGKDFSVIQIFDFPKLTQIAEWRSNEINIPLLYAKLKWVLNKLTMPVGRGRAEVLWTFERNGIGEAMSALYVNDEKPPEFAELYNDAPGKYGVYTSGKSKILSCLQLKTLIEKVNNGFTINSEILLFELKNFVAKGGSYEAKSGCTDDCVMATVGITRLIKRLAEYNDEAFKRVNEYVEANDPSDDEPLGMVF